MPDGILSMLPVIGLLSLTIGFAYVLGTSNRKDPKFTLLASLVRRASTAQNLRNGTRARSGACVPKTDTQ